MNSNLRCSVNKQTAQIKKVLEKLYARYNHRHLIKPDPLQFVYQYSNPEDMEIAGFLASALAYGRVQQIQKSVTGLLKIMGNSPFNFVQNFDNEKRDKIKGFRHRFTTGDDISNLLDLLRGVLIEFGSIENFFVKGYSPNDKNVIAALSKFCDSLLNRYAETHNGNIPKGLSYLLVRPTSGSACKRLNLFLRWMVRKDDVDSGLWKSLDKSRLVVPIDVHMGRLCRILGFHNRKIASLSTAIQITESFANIEPSDPVRYDFALSRIGILENCNGNFRPECKDCELIGFCAR
ncbi:MAG: TIGR02757 family protein [Planctomycetota bacterium]